MRLSIDQLFSSQLAARTRFFSDPATPPLDSKTMLDHSSGDERIRQETLRDQVYVCATVKVVKTTLRVARYCDNLTRSRSRRVEHRKCVVQRNLHTPNGDEIALLIVRELSATGSILQSLEIQLQSRVNVYASVRIIRIKVSPSLEKDTNQNQRGRIFMDASRQRSENPIQTPDIDEVCLVIETLCSARIAGRHFPRRGSG